MPPTVTKPRATSIPPDLAAVLSAAPVHPQLARTAMRSDTPTAATLTVAALNFAAFAGSDPDGPPPTVARSLLPDGARAVVHAVGGGGVLHLQAVDGFRAVSLVHGVLDQRCATRPRLTPGAVRLVPPGRTLTLADLTGSGALAVEVTL